MIAVEKRPTQPDLFATERWPRRPYCSDDLEQGTRIRSLAQALLKPYIQANPPHLRIWSIHDIDRPAAALAWEAAGLPPPSWAAVNPANAHAHLVWGLTAPVLVDSPDMRQGPLRYLCAVEAAYRAALGADASYTGLLTKNPSHERWRTLRGPQMAYELGELAEYVDLTKHIPKGRKVEEVGVGRNVTVFDRLRRWAYVAIRRHREHRNFVLWQAESYDKALELNGDLLQPLDPRECWHIAKSVSKWTWHKDAEAYAAFIQRQQFKGAKGAAKRWGDNEDKQTSARLMAAKGMSARAIAAELCVGKSTVARWLAT